MASAAPASRASFKLTLSFGLVQIPVQAFILTDDGAAKITRTSHSPEGNPVGHRPYDKVTGEVLNRSEITMKYTTANGALVDLSDEEIAIASGSQEQVETIIVQKPLDGISAVMEFDLPYEYYEIRPVAGAEKALKLFLHAMESLNAEALIRFTVRGRERLGVLSAAGHVGHGLLSILHWEEEIRPETQPISVSTTEAESILAKKLVESLMVTLDEVPADAFKSRLAKQVEAYAASKAEQGPDEEMLPTSTVKSVEDLMSLLLQSVQNAKT